MSEGKTPPPATGARTVRMDEALADWPSVHRTAAEWDDAAERVVSHLGSRGKSSSVSDEDLVRAPLPSTRGEVQGFAAVERQSEPTPMSHTSSRERDRASLQDLAKLAAGPPSSKTPSSGAFFGTPLPNPPSSDPGDDKRENSGMIDLAAIAAEDSTKAARTEPRKVAPAERPTPAAIDAEAISTMRSGAAVVKAEAQAVRPKSEKKSAVAWVAGSVAVAAVAAGIFFGTHRAQQAAPVAAYARLGAASPSATVVPTSNVSYATALPAADRGVDPSTLPFVAPSVPSLVATGVSGATRATTPLVATGPSAAPSASTLPTPVAAIPAATASALPPSEQSLESLMQQAAGSSPTATPAAAPTTAEAPAPAMGSVPLKPSQGAIQGALGAAMPGARACLGADDAISHATITFQSDGSVQNVAVSGSAAGKPAETCIRSALSRARVTPFAQPTFTASATVRPN